jgi:hypothetical protein
MPARLFVPVPCRVRGQLGNECHLIIGTASLLVLFFFVWTSTGIFYGSHILIFVLLGTYVEACQGDPEAGEEK